ncbi:phosphoribulokinase [Paenisporosarcina quisquiliarum]|uniref:Phosphoribulokinase n=1 Tax=Paenisporosarcina quisquiliarum TaxID=365346 RepID=A0A9X3LGS6_9BACL|nr:phosphoribulokinase [Paenisporosarcina quisquiliarum]MCZ8537728.1 phosphoribulokinase [Paenisporosarcina quisquiliarum]
MEKILQEIVHLINNIDKKIIIGISGHGASGKTTFANNLGKLLGDNNVNTINTDPYIIGSTIRKYTFLDYEYKNENHHYKMTACHPDAHNLSALERDIHMIRDGLDFYSLGLNHMSSTVLSSQNKVNIVEGMSVAFINPNLFDLKIYLYTDGDTELSRRGIRDVTERGTNINSLIQSHEERRIQYDLFMHPTHTNFDIVIKNSNEEFTLMKKELPNF